MGNTELGKTARSENPGKKPAFQITKEPVVRGTPEENVHKYEATLGEPDEPQSEAPAFEDLGPLPSSYGTDALFLVARDPQWLFCYWDIDWSAHPSSRIRDGKIFLKLRDAATGAEVYHSEITPDARNWYIPGGRGNATFYCELGFVNQAGEWEQIVRSNEATTPSDAISDQIADTFATVPYHLAFQKMLDMIGSVRAEGESLLSVLARVQGEGRRLAFVLGQAPEWTDEQRRLLASLLGHDFEHLVSLGSAEIDKLLRKQLQHRLFSESSSGLLPAEITGAMASLFSGVGFGLSSWLASWRAALETGETSSWLSSWLGGAEVGAFASWLASWPGAAESRQLSSWLASWPGIGAPGGVLSSWLASWPGAEQQSAALSSWLASWPGAAQGNFWSSWLSSWAAAAGGSETLQSSWLSSWQSAARGETFWSSWLTSWGGASKAESSFWSSWLSSWSGGLGGASGAFSSALGSSWSAQPFGKPRDFFMHVNAEVIFYGGTHPDAKVWIGGKRIRLAPDGSFRHHFTFPDGAYEIPIVAESPDGVETRCATLRFERGTRALGDVKATAQPEFLSEPIGRL